MENIQENAEAQATATTQETAATTGTQKVVSVSAVIEMLEAGKKRKEIKEALGLTHDQLKAVFEHPKLKGRKAKFERVSRSRNSLVIQDDTTDATPVDASIADGTLAAGEEGVLETETPYIPETPSVIDPEPETIEPEVEEAPVDSRPPFERG